MPLMSLGMFIFALDSVPYSELARKRGYRFGRSERQGAYSASQFLGPDDETVSLSGMLAPADIGDYGNLRVLEELIGQGDALPLVDAEGRVHGRFTVESLDTTGTYLMDNGVPRKTDFTLALKRVA